MQLRNGLEKEQTARVGAGSAAAGDHQRSRPPPGHTTDNEDRMYLKRYIAASIPLGQRMKRTSTTLLFLSIFVTTCSAQHPTSPEDPEIKMLRSTVEHLA